MKLSQNKEDQLLWVETKNLSNIKPLAKKIASTLMQTRAPFSLWLQGEIGAGKTTFTKVLFEELGLSPDFPVTSPTYTYLQEYKINGKWFAHMDLYRFSQGAVFEEEELLGARDYSGYILEWPTQVALPEALQATHKLEITCHDEKERVYRFVSASA